MFMENISDDDIIESLYMAKHCNSDSMQFVGKDQNDFEYFYLGNGVFLKRKDDKDTSFSLMELPVSNERNGNVSKIDIISEDAVVKFSAPLCSGYPVEVLVASWEGLDFGWSIANKVNGEIKYNCSIEFILDELEKSKFYGNNASRCAKSFRNIIENVLVLEKEKTNAKSKKISK